MTIAEGAVASSDRRAFARSSSLPSIETGDEPRTRKGANVVARLDALFIESLLSRVVEGWIDTDAIFKALNGHTDRTRTRRSHGFDLDGRAESGMRRDPAPATAIEPIHADARISDLVVVDQRPQFAADEASGVSMESRAHAFKGTRIRYVRNFE
ncbi:MAG: hypothetical protein AB7L94_21270 [Kofleriaceae bacterium]